MVVHVRIFIHRLDRIRIGNIEQSASTVIAGRKEEMVLPNQDRSGGVAVVVCVPFALRQSYSRSNLHECQPGCIQDRENPLTLQVENKGRTIATQIIFRLPDLFAILFIEGEDLPDVDDHPIFFDQGSGGETVIWESNSVTLG